MNEKSSKQFVINAKIKANTEFNINKMVQNYRKILF